MDNPIKNYAHDYRDMAMPEEELEKILKIFVSEIRNATLKEVEEKVSKEIGEIADEEEPNSYSAGFKAGFNDYFSEVKTILEEIKNG